jgi:hypothetical protein
MFKKYLVILLVVSLFSTLGNAAIAKNNKEFILSETVDIIDGSGLSIGTEEIDYFSERMIDEDGSIIVKINKSSKYKMKDKNTKKKDKLEVTELKVDGEGNYYINGEKLSEEFLNQEISLSESNDEISSAKNSLSAATYYEKGGYSTLTYYNEIRTDYYSVYTWSDADFFLDKSAGKYISKNVNEGNSRLATFKSYANDIYDYRTDISILSITLMVELGLAVITVASVLGAIAAGIAGAATALAIWAKSDAAHSTLTNAYSTVSKM